MFSIIRMSLGEALISLALAIMPRSHPHKQHWMEGIERAQTLLHSSP
jgi:hypothetical protein